MLRGVNAHLSSGDAVDEYSASGQTDPCGWPIHVEWTADDGIVTAEPLESEGHQGDADCWEQVTALCAYIERQRFDDVDALRAFLRQATGTRDFD